jgi:hypothetical protein
VLRRWPQLPQTIRAFIVRLVVESPPDPIGQQQRQQAALDSARELDRAIDRLMAGEPVDSKEAT